MGIDHQKMKLFFLPFLMDGTEKHTAGFDAHHGPGRQIGDGDAGLADQLIRLIIGVNTAQNRPILAAAVIQSELQELLGFLTAWQSSTFTARKSLLEKVSKST